MGGGGEWGWGGGCAGLILCSHATLLKSSTQRLRTRAHAGRARMRTHKGMASIISSSSPPPKRPSEKGPPSADDAREPAPPSTFHHICAGPSASRAARDCGGPVRKRSTRSRIDVRRDVDERPSDSNGDELELDDIENYSGHAADGARAKKRPDSYVVDFPTDRTIFSIHQTPPPPTRSHHCGKRRYART